MCAERVRNCFQTRNILGPNIIHKKLVLIAAGKKFDRGLPNPSPVLFHKQRTGIPVVELTSQEHLHCLRGMKSKFNGLANLLLNSSSTFLFLFLFFLHHIVSSLAYFNVFSLSSVTEIKNEQYKCLWH